MKTLWLAVQHWALAIFDELPDIVLLVLMFAVIALLFWIIL